MTGPQSTNRNPNATVILKALIQGQEVTVGLNTYGLSEDNELIQKFTRKKLDGTFDTEWLIVACSLRNFLDLSEKLSEAERIQIIYKTVMRNGR